MTLMDKLKIEKEIVEDYFERYFNDSINEFEHLLADAMMYSLKSGGKRIRPILMRETCQCVGGNKEDVMSYASAIEMIHTYSLIHDDLPAMDDDDLRRGKPTNHKKFGEALAILAGDGLLNFAFEVMLDDAVAKGEQRFLKASQMIAKAAGRKGMIGGQVADIESEGKKVSGEILDYIHLNKTAALIKASVLVGAVIGQCSEGEFEKLEHFGENLGLAFQIKDDILDVTGTEEVLGKPIGSDEKNNKSTYVYLYGLEEAKIKLETLTNESLDILNEINGETKFLEELTVYLSLRDM